MKIGSAFFGWLTAMGIVAILSVLLAATGAALGLGPVLNPGASSAGDVPLELDTLRWIVAGALLAIDLVAFYCGGYVAGRMARFSGVLQGLAVWLWAIVIALVVAGAGWGLSSVYDLPVDLPAFPRIPVPEDVLMIAGIIAAHAEDSNRQSARLFAASGSLREDVGIPRPDSDEAPHQRTVDGQAAMLFSAEVHYSVDRLPSRYDTVTALLVRLDDGSLIMAASSVPNDADSEIARMASDALGTLTVG